MAGEFCNTVWKKLDKMVGTKVSKLYAEGECKLGGVAQESKLYSPDSGVGKLVVCNEINFLFSFWTLDLYVPLARTYDPSSRTSGKAPPPSLPHAMALVSIPVVECLQKNFLYVPCQTNGYYYIVRSNYN